MFIGKSMTLKVITIDPDGTVLEAERLMQQHHFRHLPVVAADQKLIGIITDRDVRSLMPSSSLNEADYKVQKDRVSTFKVRNRMTQDPVTITPEDTIQDALLLIQQSKVGAIPVVDQEGRLTGIVSVRDLLRSFINVLGIGEPGTLLCILVEDKIGQMKKIVDAITSENISIGSILVARYFEPDKRAVFPYLLTQNVSRIKKKLIGLGFSLLDPMQWYMDRLPKNES